MASWTQANQNYSSRVGIVLRKSFSPLKSYMVKLMSCDTLAPNDRKPPNHSEPALLKRSILKILCIEMFSSPSLMGTV